MIDSPRLAALAVVLHQEKLLLVRRRNEPDAGLWGYPGGHVEAGETALDAAARELHEETGIVSRPRCYLDNLDIIVRDEAGNLRFHYLLAAVICDFVSGDPQAADDVSDAAWIDFDEVFSGRLPLSADVDTILRKALLARAD